LIAVDIKQRSDVALPQAALRWDEPVDISDEAQVSAAVAEVERCHGPIAGLVNAAGILGKMHLPDRLRLADCADTIMGFPLFVLGMGWRDSRQEVRQAGSAQAHPDGFFQDPTDSLNPRFTAARAIVKNLFDVAGLPTLAGSRINRDRAAAEADAALIARLEGAGAVLVGALNMGEYAYDFTGWWRCRCPCARCLSRCR
jgi:hypothetical protein